MFALQLISRSPDLCVDLIEATWCTVQNIWKGPEFWPAYRAFVTLVFQNCLLQPGVDATIADTITKVT